jgi:hypothetical protein
MTALKGIFESLCDEVESELKANLSGFRGIFVRGYLPQRWVFKTEKETVTFSVDKNGNTSVKNGAGSKPDVTINIDYEYLSTALTTQSQPSFQPKKNNVKFHTSKGKTAFNFLRDRFGL